MQLAPCCGPLPGDPIIAGMRMGHGLVVHTADCPVAMRQRLREPERWINVAWDAHTAKHLATRLDIVTRNERGVLGPAGRRSHGGRRQHHACDHAR